MMLPPPLANSALFGDLCAFAIFAAHPLADVFKEFFITQFSLGRFDLDLQLTQEVQAFPRNW